MIRRLGGKRWRRLRRLIYAIGVVHFWWLVKKDIGAPAGDAAILAVLLEFRVIAAAWKPSSGARAETNGKSPIIGGSNINRNPPRRSVLSGNTRPETSP